MIPRTLHQIWIGTRSISDEHAGFIQRWKDMYPDYDHIFWDNDRVESEGIVPPEKHIYFYSDQYPTAFKADLLRYEIIRKHGGIYIDVDTEPLRRMEDSVLDNEFFGGIQNNNEVAIGIFGGVPESKLMVDVCEDVVTNIKFHLKNEMPIKFVDQYTGPVYFTMMCVPYRTNPSYTFFPPSAFYPYWFNEKHRRNEDFKKTCPSAYSVHHWTKGWE